MYHATLMQGLITSVTSASFTLVLTNIKLVLLIPIRNTSNKNKNKTKHGFLQISGGQDAESTKQHILCKEEKLLCGLSGCHMSPAATKAKQSQLVVIIVPVCGSHSSGLAVSLHFYIVVVNRDKPGWSPAC